MASTKSGGGRGAGAGALSFDQFVEAALGAALKAAEKQGRLSGGRLRDPIWIGIVAGPLANAQDLIGGSSKKGGGGR